MKRIPLTKGQYAIVDACDYRYLVQRKWYCSTQGYAARDAARDERSGRRKAILMHRVVAKRKGLNISRRRIDHTDTNRLNNRRRNLRLATQSQNAINSGRRVDNTSGFKGVTWQKAARKWQSQIAVNGTNIYLGLFRYKIEAARAYNKAVKKHFGTFAYLNPV